MRKYQFKSLDHAFARWLFLPAAGLLLFGVSVLLDRLGGSSGIVSSLLGVGSLAAFVLAVFVLFPGRQE